MDAYLDGLLDELVPAEPRESWADVVRRARRSRRRYTAVVAAVAALVLVPAAWAAVNAFEGTPAPQVVQQNFVRWDAAVNAWNLVEVDPRTGFVARFPQADASRAHGVLQLQTADGLLDLWAAPESDGTGMCWFVSWQSDVTAGTAPPIGTGSCALGFAAISPRTWHDASHPSYTVLDGSVTGAETTLDVTLADGSTTTLPVVEHLFLGVLPDGSQLTSIIGRDATGNVVATWTPPS